MTMKRCCLGNIWLLGVVLCLGLDARAATPRMNILFIAIDDLNDWVDVQGPIGHPQAQTPNLSRLAARGVYFANAHTAVPVCQASRLALMSGMHASSTGQYGNHSIAKNSQLRLAVMLPAYLRSQGYHTMGGGKLYHHGTDSKTESADWDEVKPMYAMSREWRAKGHHYGQNFFQPFPKGGSPIIQQHGKVPGYSLCGGPLDKQDIPRGTMPDEELAQWATQRLSQIYDKPFFLAVGFARPHVPYTAPRKYFEMYDRASLTLPEVPADEFDDIPVIGKAMALCTLPGGDHWFVTNQMGPGYWRELVHSYLACVSFVDDQVGKVIAALENSPHADNTVIVLWSDHGQHLGEKKHWRKMCLWEESTKVPMLWVLPDGRNAGGVCQRPVSLLDIYPTIVEMLGQEPLAAHQGRSLRPLLDDPEAPRSAPVLSTWHYKNHSLRDQRWHYIRYRDGTEELYDHQTDASEHRNLADERRFREVVERMRTFLPRENVTFENAPENDSLGRRAQKWKADPSQIPDWLK
jgi:arylsulfatase A-like enzyme